MVLAIGFCGGLRPAQIGIQLATFSPDAHCYALLSSGQILDATYAHGVAVRKPVDLLYQWDHRIEIVTKLTPSQNIAYEYWLYSQIGKQYDTDFIWGWPLHRDWQDDDRWACSELLGAGLVEVGALVVPKMHRLTPRNLCRRVEGMVLQAGG